MTKKYKLGFDVWGLVLFLLVMTPTFYWIAVPAPNDILRNASATPLVGTLGSVFQILFVACLCFVINKGRGKLRLSPLVGAAAVCVLLYYVGWVLYYAGNTAAWVILLMTVPPCAAFILFAADRRNYPALLFACCFTVCHVVFAIGTLHSEPQVEGHYTYEHAFDYDIQGNHFDVHETGTMDFYADGSALDSARQVYTVTLADSSQTTWVFNYISPSRWRVDSVDFHFAGVKESFRMELVEGNEATELAQKIIDIYSRSIDHETIFHMDTLTTSMLQWSLTYPDGHSDTWEFYRQ